MLLYRLFFFKQKTAYEMRMSDWSSDVCSSDLTVQPAMLVHDFRAWAQPQVKGIAQHDLRVDVLELVRHHGLDAAVGTHGHEDRGLDDAMVQCELAATRGTVGLKHRELVSGHGSGFSMNMASP